MIRRRCSLIWFGCMVLAAVLILNTLPTSLALAAYPDRAIELVIKAGPGSGVDRLARMMAKLSRKHLGQPLVVVYKRGGAGAVAQAYLQKRPADGYRIFLDTCTTCIVIALGKVPFKANDWQGVLERERRKVLGGAFARNHP